MQSMNLKTLSRKLGLSQTTVSRALNGYPEVREETRARVLEAAERYNYRPNSRAKGLATGRSMSIGHVLPLGDQHQLVNPIFGDFIAGAGEVYAESGFDMVLSIVEPENELEAYRDLAAKRAVDGVIIHGPRQGDRRPDLLDNLGLPFVVHGRFPDHDSPYAWMDINNRRAFHRATEFLLDLGHERIAFINGVDDFDFARRRKAGYEQALIERGVLVDPDIQATGELSGRVGHRAARRMLDGPCPPTAILTSSIMAAFGVRRALDDLGLELGRDVSIVTHDDVLSYLDQGNALPLFTATRSSVRAAGHRCAEMLTGMIAEPGLPPGNDLWEAELTLGQSTGRARR